MLRTWFFHLCGVLSSRKQSKKSTKWHGFGLPTRESFAKRHFLLHSTNLYCSIVLCAKPCGKRPLFGHKKSSEKSMYSVPSFGGHIAISRDVTRYPILVIRGTGGGAVSRKSDFVWDALNRTLPSEARLTEIIACVQTSPISFFPVKMKTLGNTKQRKS